MVALGAALLSLWGVAESRGTSVLAVGVLGVVVLLTLIQELFSSWMFLALPVVGARVVPAGALGDHDLRRGDARGRVPQHDVR